MYKNFESIFSFITFIFITIIDNGKGQPFPGLTLQDTLDRLRIDVENLRQNLSNACSDQIHRIDQIRILEAQNEQLRTDLHLFASRLIYNERKYSNMEDTIMEHLDSSMLRLHNQISTIGSVTTRKLNQVDKTNEVWKRNFKVVNSTFNALRRKIKFRVPVVSA